jgi:signal transduction histidine kinase
MKRLKLPGATPSVTEPNKSLVFAIFFLGSLGFSTLIVFFDLGWTRRSAFGFGVAATMAIAYLAFGDRAIQTDNERQGGQFLALIIPLAGVLFVTHSAFMASLFGLYPLCFVMVDHFRSQLVAAGGHSLCALIANARWDDWSVIGIISFFFAVIMGRWIDGIVKESKGRGTLIDELTATRSELAQVQHTAGVRDERQRMSAEIHDTLTQGFSSILMLVRSAQSLVGVDDEKVRALLAGAESTAQQNLNEARALVKDLAPVALQDHSLVEALERIAQRTQTETGVLVTVELHGTPTKIEAAEEVVVLRAVQESLTNVGKHAQATHAVVALHYDTIPVSASVRDDGRGFIVGQANKDGHGLTGMYARLASVGGSMTVDSTVGVGTEVRVTLA